MFPKRQIVQLYIMYFNTAVIKYKMFFINVAVIVLRLCYNKVSKNEIYLIKGMNLHECFL